MGRIFPAFADLRLRTKGLVVLSIPVWVMLLSALMLYVGQGRQREAESWVLHTLEVRSTLQAASNYLLDAETGSRGYLLTRRSEWLGPFYRAEAQLPPLLDHLADLVRDNPQQLRKVEDLQQRALLRLESLRRLWDLRPGPGVLQNELLASRQNMREVRAALAELQDEEERLLTVRLAEAERTGRVEYRLIVLSAVFALIGGVLGVVMFSSGVASRLDQVKRNALLLASRQPLTPMERRNDEVGQLALVLAQTDRMLDDRERELRETKSFVEHLIETSPTVIFRQDPTTMAVTYVSPNVQAMLGYTPAEVLREPDFWMARIHPDDRQRVMDEDRRTLAAGQEHLEMEYRFQRKDGEYVWLQSFLRLEYDNSGNPVALLGHRLDISARKKAEAELLDRQITLDAANRELEAFSYSVSHDLRAPLRSIDGFSLALLEDYGDKLDAPGKQYLERVRNATQRMGRLIDDLLNLSRVASAPLRREDVDLSGLADSVMVELRQSQPQRDADVVIAPGMTAQGDPGLLRIVMENLLGNAWKFTGRRPRPRIEFGVMARDGAAPAYFVTDNGAGFDPQYASKLFGAFQRLHAMNDFAGTGIGLATVQRIIHRHGGHVWAEGQPGQGATFYFTLPRL